MVAKRPTGAYPKASKKANAKRVFEAGVKSGKIKPAEAGMTGAMVAKVAGKVISKVAPKVKAKTASAAKQAALKAGQTKTLADKAKLDKLASAIKDYEKRIASNKDAIKKLDLGPKQRPDAGKQFRDMTQGIKDTEKLLKEAKIQYMGLKNPWK
jgi:hypothetical protein